MAYKGVYRKRKKKDAFRIPAWLMALAALIAILFFYRDSLIPKNPPPQQSEEMHSVPNSQAGTPPLPQTQSAVWRVVQSFAKANGLKAEDYPESLIALLERNPEAEEFVLNYPLEYGKEQAVTLPELDNMGSVPLFLQWDRRWGYMDYGDNVAGLTACAPMCLSMAACYVTGDPKFSPDEMIRFARDGGYYTAGAGTEWSFISEGGSALGLDVTEIPLVESRIEANLEVNNPIICAMGPGDFTSTGHFIVLTGLEDGLLRVNDPNSRVNSEKLWRFEDIRDQIRNLWVIRYFG